jgi:hypothetical protein
MTTLRIALVASLSVACASHPTTPTVPKIEDNPARLSRFDLVPRGYDANGFALNPQFGWNYNRICHKYPDPSLRPQDPSECSWHFWTPQREDEKRLACNTYPMDPDFSTDLSSTVALTCSDSPLSYMGHLNWGRFHGGAVTYEGWVEWEGFSGRWPGDYDLNFVLTLNGRRSPGEGWNWIAVEMDSRELQPVGSDWWRSLLRKVEQHKLEVHDHVGVARAQVTGLLGIDAEHMSLRDPGLELHPAYAMALLVPCPQPECSQLQERWALLARSSGNEGLCSHWDRKHVMSVLHGGHTFRLTWAPGRTGVRVDLKRSRFCGNGSAKQPVIVAHDDRRKSLRVTVPLSEDGMVDGDLYLEWIGTPAEQEAPPAAPRIMRRDLEDPAAAQRQIDAVKADPDEKAALEATAEERDQQAGCNQLVVVDQPTEIDPLPVPKDCELMAPMNEERRQLVGLPIRAAAPQQPAEQKNVIDAYCEKRAGKSEAAAKFCAEHEGKH